jgi:predicted Zn-dependent protease
LIWLSKNEFELAKNKLTEVLRNAPDNIIIMNNISILNLYLNKVDRCFTDLKIILDKDQMNSYNETTFNNISILSELFNLNKA